MHTTTLMRSLEKLMSFVEMIAVLEGVLLTDNVASLDEIREKLNASFEELKQMKDSALKQYLQTKLRDAAKNASQKQAAASVAAAAAAKATDKEAAAQTQSKQSALPPIHNSNVAVECQHGFV